MENMNIENLELLIKFMDGYKIVRTDDMCRPNLWVRIIEGEIIDSEGMLRIKRNIIRDILYGQYELYEDRELLQWKHPLSTIARANEFIIIGNPVKGSGAFNAFRLSLHSSAICLGFYDTMENAKKACQKYFEENK